MTAQAGDALLLKVQDDGASTFSSVAGLRSRSLKLANAAIDITTSESAGRWRELLGDAGLRQAELTGAGLFRDTASDERVRALFFAGSVVPWQVVIPNFGTLEGRFMVAELTYSGPHRDALTFQMTLQSAGKLTFAALP